MPRKIKNSVVVVTGASSGIGRATAYAFSQQGASVVLAARDEKALEEVAMDCERMGGKALVVPTDTSYESAIHTLADRAIEQFGKIDTWVNNAAVNVFGAFQNIPLDDFRRVIEVNFFGYVYGSRAALRCFRSQGTGVLIQNASMVAQLQQPFSSAYVASKHAIRGFSLSLQQELLLENLKDIHVSVVMPATIDTPFFQHAGNYMGSQLKAMPPVYSAETVAKAIVSLARKPKQEKFVGNSARFLYGQSVLLPRFTRQQLALMTRRLHFYLNRPSSSTFGNLYEPMELWRGTSGGWKQTLKGSRLRRALPWFGFATIPLFLKLRQILRSQLIVGAYERPRISKAA